MKWDVSKRECKIECTAKDCPVQITMSYVETKNLENENFNIKEKFMRHSLEAHCKA